MHIQIIYYDTILYLNILHTGKEYNILNKYCACAARVLAAF